MYLSLIITTHKANSDCWIIMYLWSSVNCLSYIHCYFCVFWQEMTRQNDIATSIGVLYGLLVLWFCHDNVLIFITTRRLLMISNNRANELKRSRPILCYTSDISCQNLNWNCHVQSNLFRRIWPKCSNNLWYAWYLYEPQLADISVCSWGKRKIR